jgi:hypothetical protein
MERLTSESQHCYFTCKKCLAEPNACVNGTTT